MSVTNTAPTVSTAYACHLFEYLRITGVDPKDLYGADAVERHARADPGSRFPVDEWDRMAAQAEAAIGDSALLLKLAQFLRPPDVGAIGFVTMASANLHEAFAALATFFNLFNDAYTLHGVARDEQFLIELRPTHERRFPRLEAYMLALMCRHARFLARNSRLAFDTSLAFAAPPSDAARLAYQATFRGELRFDETASAIHGPVAYADLRVSMGDSGLADTMRQELKSRLSMLHSQSQLFLARVERIVRTQLRRGDVSLEEVATELGMHARTLQARLQRSGASFRNLVDSSRRTQALQLVADPAISLTQVGRMLGYATVSSFHHAFRRWSGMAPSTYRRGKLDADAATDPQPQGRRQPDG